MKRIKQLNRSKFSFWDQIGRPRFIAAPMVDHSELPFRLLMRSNGVDLAFTQMISSNGIISGEKYRKQYFDWVDYSLNVQSLEEKQKLKQFVENFDSPLVVQVNGNDPKTLTEAGQYIQQSSISIAAIDLNLGCPQQIAKRGNYGAYLLNSKDQSILLNILASLRKSLNIPISVKIRKLSSGDNETVELVRKMEQECGISMITVHGRTISQSKSTVGSCDWDIIKKIKASVKIPVIANGGIYSYEDAIRCLDITGADAVMSSEALLENPKLFNTGHHEFHLEHYIASQLQTTEEYLQLVKLFTTTRSSVTSHLMKLLHCFIYSPMNIDLRERIVRNRGEIVEFFKVFAELKDRMSKYSKSGDKKQAEIDGYFSEATWYFRHRKTEIPNNLSADSVHNV